ncbi:HNH endonuclease [Actinoplanes sp. TRM 88003]|uniref:HNH endonuclease n=1 Tax=Paractinoplanes aksuensis TaxID=2939490 RepID=A0ABT1E0Y0_9ACTN|nr:HNH endonuclease signature motif containing protein [Actinoplanes aksuensis]MCO8276743.1 HNH endonuclease [Actinoplanes aksuensis]
MLVEMEQLNEEAAKLAAAPLWPLTDDELTGLLRTTHHLQQVVTTLQARLIRQADTRALPAAGGHRTLTGWLRTVVRLDPQPARELTDLAAALAHQPSLEQAVLDGHLDLRQAAVIAETLRGLPADLAEFDDVTPAEAGDIAEQARATMTEMAAQLPAFQLRRVGERILAHVAPHLAEQFEQAALARQEARARAKRGVTLSLPVDGLVRLSGVLGAEDAATVQAALHPLCAPTPGDDRTKAQRRADALVDVCRLALRTADLPEDGGEPPQLAVTVAFDPLTRALGAATTDTGNRLSPETARRLACDARILPVVLGGAGQILDAGRTRRLAGGTLRRALHVRDGGCVFPHCDRPPRWTDAHHIVSWLDGGPTALDNLALLCREHHRLVHHPTAGWQIRLGPDRKPEFIPPPAVDATRRPRRNVYHRRE